MSQTAPRPSLPPIEYVSFGLLSAVLLLGAVIASFLGRFLSYAALETTRSEASFNSAMGFAVWGPFVILGIAVLVGLVLYSVRRRAWFVPLIGLVALVVNFNVIAVFLAT